MEKDALTLTIREAEGADYDALRVLLRSGGYKASRRTVAKWLSQNNFTVRLMCRNVRHPIAVCVSRTTPRGTRVLFLHVTPPYEGRDLDRRLLLLASAELPEQDTVIQVPQSDTKLAERLRALGWKVTGTDREHDEYVFGRRLYRPGEGGGGQVAPPAGGNP